MDQKINSDLKSLKFIFNKNKSYIIPIVIILTSVILFFQFVIPQFGVLLATREKVKVASLKLETLKANLDILKNINEETLDSQLKILTSALPLDKDFIGVLNSIYSTAQKTGVSLGSFSFKIGDLAQSGSGDNVPVINLSVPVNAGIAAVSSFVETISKELPLSETYLVRVGNMSSTVSLSFYYRPLGVSSYSQDVRVSPISQKGLTLIRQLSGFGDSAPSPISSTPNATPSASQ